MWPVRMNKLCLVVIALSLMSCSTSSKPPVVVPIDVVDSGPENNVVDIAAIPDAIPQYEPWSKSVNPESYQVLGKTYHVLSSNKNYRQQGIASWYGTKFHQKKTATGEIYDMWQMTAAHKTLPIPSYARVTNLNNQRSVIVKVNDRGPFHEHRIIDLSYAAAAKLGLDKLGTGFVEVVAVQPGELKTVVPVAPVKKIYLQIGAFSDEDNALKLQQKVAQLRLTKSRIISSKVLETTFYKVQLGPVSSVLDADDITEKLKAAGIQSSQFVVD